MADGLEKEYEKEHIKRILRLTGNPSVSGVTALRSGRIGGIMLRAAETLSKDLSNFRGRHPQGNYSGNAYRMNANLEKQIARTLTTLRDDLTISIEDAMVNQWQLANKKNDKLVEQFVKGRNVAPPVLRSMNQLNIGAMNAFISRAENGMDLSGRVWNYAVAGNKDLLEEYLASGIMMGRSADKISRDIRELLVEPKRLFRRIRNEQGKLVPSKAMKAYHPGAGVYRSSYKNALRLAATETNMAYRMSDTTRRRQLPFITGIVVHLSSSHPALDICDSMAGEYPVGFTFLGWHPRCLCYTTSKMIPRDEMKAFLKTGKVAPERYTANIPEKAAQYVASHNRQIMGWESRPYWHLDNFTVDGGVKASIYKIQKVTYETP